MIDLPIGDQNLLLEIVAAPQDCYLPNRSRTMLRRLMILGLIEVETRKMSVWHAPAPKDWRSPEWREFVEAKKRRAWNDRVEVHARLTHDGYAWYDDFRRAAINNHEV